MEEEEGSRTLPEDLVETIVAMVPFPQIFKARVLSKSWLARLSPGSSQEDDEDKKRLATSFQKRLREYSTKWQIFTPAFVRNKDLVAYDRESQHWLTIPTLSLIPQNQLTWHEYSLMRIQAVKGALILITTGSQDLYVANVITRSWKRLPPAPNTTDRCHQGTLASTADAYKVIRLFTDGGYLFGQIYHSQLGTWICKRTSISTDLRFSFDMGEPGTESPNGGVFYWLVYNPQGIAWGLLAFNVKQGTFQIIQQPHLYGLSPQISDTLVVCNGSLLLASYENTGDDHRQIITLLEIDLASGRWLDVTRGPPDALEFGECCKLATGDGKSIFFLHVYLNAILAYDVHMDEWSCFSSPEVDVERIYEEYETVDLFSFQPGLNPFVTL